MTSAVADTFTILIAGCEPITFKADITTSNFLKNMRDDMEDTGDIIDLRECPCEFSNMSIDESLRFIKLWEAVSTESGKKLNEVLEPQIVCINPVVLEPISELIKQTEQDMVSTDEYIIAEFKKRSIELRHDDFAEIKQGKTYQDLVETIALPILFKFIRLSNFLDIPTLLKLFSYLIARSMRTFTKLNKDIKPVHMVEAEEELLAEPLDLEEESD